MSGGTKDTPEIESFNLADLDVAALDVRLELTSLIPACTLRICNGNDTCKTQCVMDCNHKCGGNTGCNVDNS